MVLSVLVGVLVTIVAAVLPARRASRVAPVAAMRGNAGAVTGGLGRRGLIGIGVLSAGAVVLGVAVSREHVSWPVAALGAVAAVLGLLVGAPLATRPVVRLVSWPFVALSRSGGEARPRERAARPAPYRRPRRAP